MGYVKAKFTWGDITAEQIVYVCRGIKRALLGKPAIRSLRIVELRIPENYSCAEIEELLQSEMEEEIHEVEDKESQTKIEDYPMLKEFPELYNRLGKIEVGGEIKIRLKENTTPHQTYSPRHIPLPQMKKVVEELKKMLKLGVIRKIDKPTKCCHPIVIVLKPNGDI